MRASRGYRAAAEHIAGQLRAYGLDDVEILRFPADGKTMFGTQKSRPAWDIESAELWELEESGGKWVPAVRIGDWYSMPLSLAQDSDSADVVADLVDVGAGTAETDYRDRDVRGKLVLVSSQPESVQTLAVDRYGAAGIVSHAQNQRTAWWGEDDEPRALGTPRQLLAHPTFAFMVSPETGAGLAAAPRGGRNGPAARARRRRPPRRPLRHRDGADSWRDPSLAAEEIAFSCHLDHPRPGPTTMPAAAPRSSKSRARYAKLIREGRCRDRRGRCDSSGRPRSREPRSCSMHDRTWRDASRPSSTWTWSAAVPRPRRSFTSPDHRRACHRSSTTWPKPSVTS